MLRDARCRYAAARAALRANTGAGTHLLRRQSRERKIVFRAAGKIKRPGSHIERWLGASWLARRRSAPRTPRRAAPRWRCRS